MESPHLDLWERFDYDPTDSAVDFGTESLARYSSVGTLGSSFELEQNNEPSIEDLYGLSEARPLPETEQDPCEKEMMESEALFRELEALAQGFSVPVAPAFSHGAPSGVLSNHPIADPGAISDSVEELLNLKQEFENFDVPGCHLFSDLPYDDNVRSDCMWSSTLRNLAESPSRRSCSRIRDHSLSLSECQGGLISPTFMAGMCPLFDVPLPAAESVASHEDPVVQDIKPNVELETIVHQDPEPQPVTNSAFASNLTHMDHCYFSVQPPSPKPVRGVGLNEGCAASNIDKRKLAHAVQSLVKKNCINTLIQKSGSNETIKFKLRVKLRSDPNPFTNGKRHGIVKQRTVLKPVSSPPVVLEPRSRSLPNTPLVPKFQQSLLVLNNGNLSPKLTSGSCRASPNQDQKVREIRDLHNSMERQRRVDLRKKFDRLKSVVPELVELEKTSKLNILSKASQYCTQLTRADAQLKKEADREAARNHQLRKKLQTYKNFFNIRTNRVSVVNNRSRF
jgi:hypothetical protein